MVEKIWVCYRCNYVPQNIPYDEQPWVCPKCGSPCKQVDYFPKEFFEADMKARMADARREGRVFEPVNPDEKGREARIKETIEGMTNRRYEIIASKENLIIRFKKTEEEKDIILREELEKKLLKFRPRILFVNFF